MRLSQVWQWKKRNPKRFEIALSIVIGVLIEIALTISQPPPLLIVRKVADETADRMIRLADQVGTTTLPTPAITLIDIDDATWLEWGANVVTPRDRIAVLLHRIAASQPLAIVLDVDLSYPDPKGEGVLYGVLQNYPDNAPPLILVRALKHLALKPHAPPEQRITIYELPFEGKVPVLEGKDASVDGKEPTVGSQVPAVKGKENITFAAPLFERDADGLVRRWRLFVQTCIDNHPQVVPAAHVAAAVLAREAVAHKTNTLAAHPIWQKLSSNLAAFNADNCEATRPIEKGVIAADTEFARKIAVDRTDASTRIIYRVGWRNGAAALGPSIVMDGIHMPLVSVRPARLVTSPEATTPIPGLVGHIVIVGGSFADSGDWHQTPLGRMPGSLLLANAILALTINGTPTEPDFWKRTKISLVIIAFAAVCAAYLRAIVAGLASATFVVAIMLLSLRSFQSGVVIDLAVPAVGAAIHDFGATFINFIRDVWQEGPKWVLKKPEEKSIAEEAIATSEPSSEPEHST
jgi:CHASE2 domain-containing sensor protein